MIQEYGLSGFLAPDGTFHSCGYMEHRELAKKIVKEYGIKFEDVNKVDGFIKFGCTPWAGKKGNDMCHVFASSAPTKAQEKWIIEHKNFMTDKQRRMALAELDDWEETEQ